MNKSIRYFNILRKKPLLVPKIMHQLLLSRILKKKVLRGIEMAITYRCQAKCQKCSCCKLIDYNRDELSTEDVIDICRRVVQSGGILVNFTGGEPLLRNDIEDIVSYFRILPCIVSITTNGLLATKDMLRRLLKCGLDVMQISINSPVPEEHDEEVGILGSFNQVMKAIENARALGIEVLINTVVTRDVLRSYRLEAIAEIAVRNKSLLSLIFPAAVGGWSENDVNLSQDDYIFIKKCWLNRGYVTNDIETSYKRGFCPAGTEKIYVTPYGDLFQCPFIQKCEGNIHDKDIIEIWKNIPLKIPLQEHKGCRNIIGIR